MKNERTRIKVLLIEDDRATQIALAHRLAEEAGAQVYAVSSHEGATAYRDMDFDIIFADLNLPDARNDEIIAHCAKDFPEVPVIVVSVKTERELVRKVSDYPNVVDYIPKATLTAHDLGQKIRRVLAVFAAAVHIH